MSIEPGTTLPKQIVLRNDAATWRLMQERRRLFGIDPSNFRPRRKSSVVGIVPIMPPLPEPEIVKPLMITSIDSEELDLEDTEPTPLEPEISPVPVAVAAGEESEPETEETEESGEEWRNSEAHVEVEL